MLYIIVGICLGILIYKAINNAKFWENRDVICEPALPLVGNMGGIILRKKHFMDIVLDLYRKYPNNKYLGLMQFTRPILMVRDLELIKKITVKDFEYFHDHFSFSSNKNDPLLGKSLINLKGQKWRHMRSTLSPVFTSSKMRIMYNLMQECAENFVGHFKGKEQFAVEMKDILTRYTIDVIATTAFGIQINSLEDPNNSFFLNGKRLNQGVFVLIKLLLLSKIPIVGKYYESSVLPSEITEFFRTIIKDNILKRERDGIIRPDMIHLLMEARKGALRNETEKINHEGFAIVQESDIGQKSTQIPLTDDDIVAQGMLFFFAGFETVSTAGSLLAYELAINPDIQKKLQKEIDEVQKQNLGKVTYETILGMKYLDQVVSEILRMWPVAIVGDRICTKRYKIEPQNRNEKEIWLEEGDSVMIPTIAIHRDPQYYPNPDKFDPERFNDENKSKIIPGSYLPFGVGPRNCIGSRFALLEIKTLFYYLLLKFDIVPVTGTQIPLKISPKQNNLTTENGFRLGMKPRKI